MQLYDDQFAHSLGLFIVISFCLFLSLSLNAPKRFTHSICPLLLHLSW